MMKEDLIKHESGPTHGVTPLDQTPVKYNKGSIALLTATGMLGGISVGYNMGIVGGACLYLDDSFPEKVTVTDKSVSGTTSIMI
jgi:MFS family permease